MARYELSKLADQDLKEIYLYSLTNFGELQADKYLNDLNLCLQNLSKSPQQGRMVRDIQEGVYKFSFVSHMIFYVIRPPGIFVARVLHKKMDHKYHLDNT